MTAPSLTLPRCRKWQQGRDILSSPLRTFPDTRDFSQIHEGLASAVTRENARLRRLPPGTSIALSDGCMRLAPLISILWKLDGRRGLPRLRFASSHEQT